MHIISECHGTS